MMKFSKSLFPDPGKQPRRGGGTRPPSPEQQRGPPPPRPPAGTVMQTPNTPQPAAAALAPRPVPPPPRAAFGGRPPAAGCGAARVIFAVIPPPSPVLQYGAQLPRRERGKEPFSGAHQPPPARLSRLPPPLPGPEAASRRPPARRPGRGPSRGAESSGAPAAGPGRPNPVAIPARYSLGRPSPPFHQVLDSALRSAGGKDTASAGPAGRPPPAAAAALLTFRIRFFSMLSTAKTCSPTAGSSMLQPGGAGPGVRGRRSSRDEL